MQKVKKSYRKKNTETTESTALEALKDDAETVRLKLLQTKELQKLRERSKGVNAGVGSDLNLPPATIQEEKSSSLDSNFTSQNDKPEVNHYQEKYVEEMMKKRESSTTAENEGSQTTENSNKTPFPGSDADLYTTPDHLKTEVKRPTTDTANWLTGIVEVQLPVEYKLKNIEETEKAKRDLLNQVQPSPRNTFGEANLYGPSFASIRYQTDRQPKRNNTTAAGNERATDDIVMERFKKRFRK